MITHLIYISWKRRNHLINVSGFSVNTLYLLISRENLDRTSEWRLKKAKYQLISIS